SRSDARGAICLGSTNGRAEARSRAARVWAYAWVPHIQCRPGLEPGPITTNVGVARSWDPQPILTTTPCGYGSRLKAGTTSRLLHRLQQRYVIRNRGATHVEDAREFCVFDLHALGRLTQELHRGHHMHRDAGGADRVAFCLQAAGWIDRQFAVLLRPAFLDGTGALPARRQSHRLIFDQFGDGEAVMGFDKGQIREIYAGRLQRALPGYRAALELQNVAFRHRQEILG